MIMKLAIVRNATRHACNHERLGVSKAMKQVIADDPVKAVKNTWFQDSGPMNGDANATPDWSTQMRAACNSEHDILYGWLHCTNYCGSPRLRV